jgi:polyisoprenoid-binding protein YceI
LALQAYLNTNLGLCTQEWGHLLEPARPYNYPHFRKHPYRCFWLDIGSQGVYLSLVLTVWFRTPTVWLRNFRLSQLMRILISTLLFALVSLTGFSQPIYSTNSGRASFFSDAPLEDIEAKSTKLQAAVNAGSKKLAFSIPIKSFQFEKSLMQEHFNEKYLESDKYPNATFTGVLVNPPDLTKNGSYEVEAKGKLKIHGVEQDRTVKGTLKVEGTQINLQAVFPVRVADHKIEIPQLVFEKIAEVVEVTINATLAPATPK